MQFDVPPLPWSKAALQPHMSSETVEFHYEKHHRGYMRKLRKAVEGTPDAERGLEELIRTAEGKVRDNAAQVWNHTFFWESMEPRGGGAPGGEAARLLERDFDGFDAFREAFVQAGTSRFGSGYVWLVLRGDDPVVIDTPNADNPLAGDDVPLLCCDVWEHAYYLDHRNDRARYLQGFLDHLVNWDRVAQRAREASVAHGR